jgi:hypothetical protein
MGKPRIFISSTYYDLKQIRSNLENFIKNMGYDPVLHERGAIPYGKEFSLEEYCYKEIQYSDIFISIIGGRYGSESNEKPYSISQNELKTAFKLDKQVYIFIEKNVMAEYNTYLKNKDKKDIEFHYVNNKKIYEFINEVYHLSLNNQIYPFESSDDIIDYLKYQWAGLFQRLLQEENQKNEIRIVEKLSETTDSLDKMLNYLKSTNSEKSEIIQNILSSKHPVFQQIKELLQVNYRIYFESFNELSAILKVNRWQPVSNIFWDDPNVAEWSRKNYLGEGKLSTLFLQVSKAIFTSDGKLININAQDWDKNNIKIVEVFEVPDTDNTSIS